MKLLHFEQSFLSHTFWLTACDVAPLSLTSIKKLIIYDFYHRISVRCTIYFVYFLHLLQCPTTMANPSSQSVSICCHAPLEDNAKFTVRRAIHYSLISMPSVFRLRLHLASTLILQLLQPSPHQLFAPLFI